MPVGAESRRCQLWASSRGRKEAASLWDSLTVLPVGWGKGPGWAGVW